MEQTQGLILIWVQVAEVQVVEDVHIQKEQKVPMAVMVEEWFT